MSWTAPITYTTGMLMTAVIANQQWRDNSLLLATHIETATGRWNGELKNFREEVTTLANVAGTVAIDVSAANNGKLTLAANVSTITVTGWTAAKDQTYKLRLTQDGTGGRTVAWPAGWKWSGNAPPTMTATANKTDIVILSSDDGGTTIFASMFTVNA